MAGDRTATTRRAWLGTVVGVLGSVGGCNTRSDAEPSPTEITTSAPTATTEQEALTTQPVETATEPTPSSDRVTPTATPPLNQTDFAVRQLFGPDDDYHGTRGPSVTGGRVRVQLVAGRTDWKTVLREIEADTGVSYEGLPFVSETTFGAEIIVAVWVEISDSRHARLVNVTREDDKTVRLRVTGAGNFGAQVNVGRVLLVRVSNATGIRRAVAVYTEDGGERDVVTAVETPASETATDRKARIQTGDLLEADKYF